MFLCSMRIPFLFPPTYLPHTRTGARTRAHAHARTGLLGDLHRLNTSTLTWTRLAGTGGNSSAPPAPRYLAGMAFAGGRLYVYGGLSGGEGGFGARPPRASMH